MRILAALFVLGLGFGPVVRAEADLDLEALIRNADKLTLYSINPHPIVIEFFPSDMGPAKRGAPHLDPALGKFATPGVPIADERTQKEPEEFLHNFAVLGKVVATDQPTLSAIRAAVLDALKSAEDGATAMCFDPRHGIRLQKSDLQVDVLLCFECHKGCVFYSADGKNHQSYFGIGPAGNEALNRLLDAQKIPRDLPPAEKKAE